MFRILKVLIILGVVGALTRWYLGHHTEDRIVELVNRRSTELPKVIAPGVNWVGLEFANHTLRNTLELTEKQDFGLHRAEREQVLLEMYCRGAAKQFADAGISAEYIINYRTELGIASTATITLQPQKCG